jgi:hypothetical protein
MLCGRQSQLIARARACLRSLGCNTSEVESFDEQPQWQNEFKEAARHKVNHVQVQTKEFQQGTGEQRCVANNPQHCQWSWDESRALQHIGKRHRPQAESEHRDDKGRMTPCHQQIAQS